ncbi:MAG: sn-glycerol-1-phosphate dehydrogenase [Actinomycetaceae bacterium]|nr:sn-glycerol-1-phosphate dehydrogenase [Actinomycetaceae bacterium]MDY6082657.1 sn-glycerol-1-phosphate dehydrogenase [Actinomycetaceae bacterium]
MNKENSEEEGYVMSSEMIERALATATQTKDIEFGDGVVAQTGALFQRLFASKRAQVVADENTFGAAGRAVMDSLKAAGVECAEPYVFPGHPTLYANWENVLNVRALVAEDPDAILVSIGSGTLNDLAKLASGQLDRPYMIVATAASVDGFASFGASIVKDGFKSTYSCPAPAGIVMDSSIMYGAPARLTATGYGDLIEKIPAGADWMLADALGIEAIDPIAWDLVQGPLRATLADPDAIARGDKDAIAKLGEGQIMSGLAMQEYQQSRPASGVGHHFSHVWEMEGQGLDWEPPLSHGFKVGIGTIASCAIWEEFLALTPDDFNVDRAQAAVKTPEEITQRVHEMVIPKIWDTATQFCLDKRVEGKELEDRIHLLAQQWPQLHERAEQQVVKPEEAMSMLKAAGAPYHPAQIKITKERLRKTHYQAQMIRTRYTVVDILTDLGLMDQVVDHLFSADGFWGRHSADWE